MNQQSNLTSEYVSFGHVVNPSGKERTDTYTSTNTPTFKKEISLFPLFDKFILYTPSYVIKNRDKRIHIPVLVLVLIMFIVKACNHIIFFLSVGKEHPLYTYDTQIFVALMFILPWINNMIRLRYFVKYFNFQLWHYPSYINPKSGVKTINNQILNKLSFLLREPAYLKSIIGKRFRTGWFCIMAILFTSMVFRVLAFQMYSKSVIIFFDVTPTIAWIYGISWSLLYVFCFDIPDLLCLLVARIHFIECQLYLTHFTKELISMSLDEIIESHLFHKYLMMQKDIKQYVNKFRYFVLIMLLQVLCGCWYGVNYISSIQTWNHLLQFDTKGITIWVIFWLASIFVTALQLMFALHPALQMTQLNDNLLQKVNLKIDDIMLNRQRFHDENLLNDFRDIVCKKHSKGSQSLSPYTNTTKLNDKSIELKDKIGKYSLQKESLIILNQLLYEIEKNPCSVQLMGFKIDTKLIKNMIIAIIVCQIFSVMWMAV